MIHIIFDLHNTLIFKAQSYGAIIQDFLSVSKHDLIEKSTLEIFEKNILQKISGYDHSKLNLMNSKFHWLKCFNQSLYELNTVLPISAELISNHLYHALEEEAAWEFYKDVPSTIQFLNEQNIGYGFLTNWDSRIRKLWRELAAKIGVVDNLSLYSCDAGYCKPSIHLFKKYQNIVKQDSAKRIRFISVGDCIETDSGGSSLGIEFCLVKRQNINFHLIDAISKSINNE